MKSNKNIHQLHVMKMYSIIIINEYHQLMVIQWETNNGAKNRDISIIVTEFTMKLMLH